VIRAFEAEDLASVRRITNVELSALGPEKFPALRILRRAWEWLGIAWDLGVPIGETTPLWRGLEDLRSMALQGKVEGDSKVIREALQVAESLAGKRFGEVVAACEERIRHPDSGTRGPEANLPERLALAQAMFSRGQIREAAEVLQDVRSRLGGADVIH
jgi:hypothetical protein